MPAGQAGKPCRRGFDGQPLSWTKSCPVTFTNRAAGLSRLLGMWGRRRDCGSGSTAHAREFVAFGFQIVEILPDTLHLFAAFPNELLDLRIGPETAS